MPLLGLAFAWGEWGAGLLAGVAILLSRVGYPADFGNLLRRKAGATALVDARNLAMIALIGTSLWMLRKRVR